jgi:membrane protein DedA with SNARE-associated domain/rhodanese-related sulfurtransferase
VGPWSQALAHHGYALLFGAVFLEAIGLPVPAALALLIAGAAAANGTLGAAVALAGSVGAMLVGDTLMYLLGRYTGWWLLGLLCRISLNPEGCILRTADSFYRRGRMLLVFAKFIPGINTMAPPLAGSMNMLFWPFLKLDLTGAALYVLGWFGVGFVFSDFLETITRGYQLFGRALGWSVAILIAGYGIFLIGLWVKAHRQSAVPFVLPDEAARTMASAEAWICDVRSHGYLDAKAIRIRGSRRLDPNALNRSKGTLPTDRPVFVYCTCLREATSARVARDLLAEGVRVAVIKGGLRAWKKAGLPVEPVPPGEVAQFPVFH